MNLEGNKAKSRWELERSEKSCLHSSEGQRAKVRRAGLHLYKRKDRRGVDQGNWCWSESLRAEDGFTLFQFLKWENLVEETSVLLFCWFCPRKLRFISQNQIFIMCHNSKKPRVRKWCHVKVCISYLTLSTFDWKLKKMRQSQQAVDSEWMS